MIADWITPQQYRPGTVYNIPELARPRGNARCHKRRYKDVVCAFDIETTTLRPPTTGDRPQAIMYVWQFCIYGHCIVVGRTWEEFRRFISELDDELTDDRPQKTPLRLAVYVHNLSFEFQFLKGLYEFSDDDVFCMASRKILRADLTEHIELRCSYLHSNMPLGLFLDKMHVEHRKLSGAEYDYTRTRYPWTPLTDSELAYAINDVLGLCEAITAEMAIDGDTLHTIPATSTGYVRRDIKHAMHKLSRLWLPQILPDEHVYTLLRDAFRGGDTHASRFMSGRVLENVTSADRSSSYPGVQMNHLYPAGEWSVEPNPTHDRLHTLIYKRRRAVVFRATFIGLKLRYRWEACPYISRDKCSSITNGFYDNGRVLSADALTTTLTDVDYSILTEQYYYDNMFVEDAAYCAYKPLPECLKDVIRKYYRLKTELKQDPHSPTYDPQIDILYTKSKNKLNAIYGCSAQDPAKDTILYDNGNYTPENKPLSERLSKAYKHAFFSYAFGVWCTAWARYELHEGIKLVQNTPGAEFVYCDTDSVKYTGVVDWSAYNARKQAESESSGAYADDPQGVRHYMEVYEPDGIYQRFATLGAKKYCYTKPGKDGLYITIAGVTKSKGGDELLRGDKYGKGIERFAAAGEAGREFLFRDAGGTESLYNDHIDTTVIIDGHPLRITDNVVIQDSTYLLSITEEYSALLQLEILAKSDPDAFWGNQY